MISAISIRDQYTDTFYKIGKEALKTATVVAALCVSTLAYFSDKIKYRAVFVIVGYSIVDEVIARGLFQNFIHLIQRLWNTYFNNGELTHERLEYQKSFRIIFASLLYASAQLLVSDLPARQIMRFALTFFSGLSYGHLKENTDSLLPSILLHAGRNICILTCSAGLPAIIAFTAIFVYDVLSYYLATGTAAIYPRLTLPF